MADRVKKSVSDAPALNSGRPYPRVQKHFLKPSKTRASEMASTDLKTIVSRWRLAGAPPPSHSQYGDTTTLPTTRLEAMLRIDAAQDAFRSLPLKVRQAIGHDYRNLEAWIAANPQLAVEAGLIEVTSLKSSPANPTSSADAEEGKKGSGEADKAPAASSSGGQPAST